MLYTIQASTDPWQQAIMDAMAGLTEVPTLDEPLPVVEGEVIFPFRMSRYSG